MPSTVIKNIGRVDYTYKQLPEEIKGKSMIGVYDFPIVINESLEAGAKLDYIVAHEVGHRLTLDMVINADKENPKLFDHAPYPSAALVRYLINLGLEESHMHPRHPKTKQFLHQIFEENKQDKWTEDYLAREFIAEVYANWATGEGLMPLAIAERFGTLTQSKNAILISKGLLGQEEIETAAFVENPFNLTEEQQNILATGAVVLIGIFFLKGLF